MGKDDVVDVVAAAALVLVVVVVGPRGKRGNCCRRDPLLSSNRADP